MAAGHPFALARLYAAPWPDKHEQMAPAERMEWLKQNHPELQASFARVHLAYDTLHTTVVPTAVYREGTGTDYFELVFGAVDNEQLHRDSLPAAQVELISAMPIGLAVAATHHFHNLRLFSADAVMFQRLSRSWQEGKTYGLLLRLANTQLSAWLYRGDQLQVYNQYYVADPADVLYYASLLAEQHQPRLLLCGHGLLYDDSQALLASYFADMHPLETEKSLAYDAQWSALPAAQLQLLLATLCAS